MRSNFFFFLLCLLTNFKFSFSYFNQPIKVNKALENDSSNWENEETVKFSKTLDMGNCTCDLTNLCDHRCCCDKDCSEDIKNSWIEQKICKNINKNRMEGYKCKSKEENFNYNKKNAGITVKDHIHDIMCIYYDRSGDMGNFYINDVNDESLKENRNNWIDKFFNINEEDNRRRRLQTGATKYEYGDIIDFPKFKSYSKNCKSKNIFYLIPFESLCEYNKDNFQTPHLDYIQYEPNYFGENDYFSEITYIFDYDNGTITNQTIDILTTSQTTKQINLKVLWKKKNVNMNKNVPSGYFQGNPIKIAFEKEKKFEYYEKGFFIAMKNRNGLRCPTDLDNAKNPSPILFKNNIIYSCKRNTNTDTERSYIEKILCNKILRLAKSPNQPIEEVNNSNSWIPIYTDCGYINELTDDNDDIIINLLILTSKDGKEDSPNEHIEYAKLDSYKKSGGKGIISFSIKFVELSYSSLMKSRDGKITSLIPLPEEILKSLNKK